MAVSFQNGKGVVPVFPLPNVILYPKALLPLHVFEPRYMEMVRDCLEGDKQMVMGLFKPGWESDYFGRPEIYPIAGLGEIVHWDRMANGKYNILLRGLARVKIDEEFGGGPYRIGQVHVVEESDVDTSLFEKEKVKLLSGLKRMSEESVSVPNLVEIDHLAHIVTIALPIEVHRKQELFEILDIRERVNRVLEVLEEVLSRKRDYRRLEGFTATDSSLN